MARHAWVLALTLLPALAAGASDPSTGAAASSSSSSSHLPSIFRLFPVELSTSPPIDLAGLPDEKRLFHQQGDPDSLFTLGSPTPEGQLHLKAAIEVNEIFLKAIPPEARVGSPDTRPRAAGSFLPLDASGRPYQLRLGARLVW